ncbi:MAG: hypothetical protein AB1724_05395 [Thermodesulfobacteriota bacterium]
MSPHLRTKRFAIALLALIACCAFFPGASPAAEVKDITIIYTGSVRGNFEPCHS